MDLTRTSTIWKDDYNFDVVNFYKFSNMTVYPSFISTLNYCLLSSFLIHPSFCAFAVSLVLFTNRNQVCGAVIRVSVRQRRS